MKSGLIWMIFCVFAVQCCTTQQPKDNSEARLTDLTKEGYTWVETITTKSPAPCHTLFQTKEKEVLDFINLEEFTTSVESEYWVKFQRLRRTNRCKNAQPANLIDLKSVETAQ